MGLESLPRDLLYALRLLRRSLGFTATAVAVLALGIGANTAIFSVVNTVLLHPLPYPDSDRLVQVMVHTATGNVDLTSVSRFAFWRANTQAFERIAAFDLGRPGVTLPGDSRQQFRVMHASADYFPMFGAEPQLGRTFAASEDRPGGTPVAVISDALWRHRFNADPNLAGKALSLDGGSYDVVGVLRPGFIPDPPADIWLPLQANPYSTDHSTRIRVVARLNRNVTLDMAQRQLRYISWPFQRQFPGVMGPREGFSADLLRNRVVGDIGPALFILSGAVVFVLLIACANVANLLMARAARRTREIATRAALGASRWRIVAQLFAESALLAALGGVAGLALGQAGVRILVAINPGNIPRLGELAALRGVALDPQVVAFTIAITAITGALFGLLPAIAASRVDLSGTLNESSAGASSGSRQSTARSILVIAETALALVLLVGSGLLIRTFMAMHSVDRGFDAANVLTLEMSLGTPRFEQTAAIAQLVRETEARIERLPGVLSLASTISLPLEPSMALPFTVARRPLINGPYHGIANWRAVSLHYFDVFRIRLKRGRLFTEDHERGAGRVAIINDTFARKHWPGGNPLGEVLLINSGLHLETTDPPREIIGVVADVRDTGLNRDLEPIVYVPAAQVTDAMNTATWRSRPLTWTVRTSGDPWRLSAEIQQELRAASGGLPIGRIRSMEDVVAESTARTTFTMTLLSVFAAIALVMAAVGIYGLVSYSVEQRTREIGIRVAIGAGPGDVRSLVLADGMRLALFGVTTGAIVALGLTKVMDALIYGVQSWDPLVFVAAGAILCVVAAGAAYIPAVRATRVDPVTALRCD